MPCPLKGDKTPEIVRHLLLAAEILDENRVTEKEVVICVACGQGVVIRAHQRNRIELRMRGDVKLIEISWAGVLYISFWRIWSESFREHTTRNIRFLGHHKF